MKFTKGRFKAASYRPRIHSMMLPDFIRVLWSDDVMVIDLFYPLWNSSFGGDCWMWVELEGKLEFPSYSPLSLVPHWIGHGRLGSIYTNTSHAYCYECWAMGHIPTRAHTRRTEPGRAGCGWRAPTTCGHECSSIQGLVGPATFCFLFFI